MHEIRRPIQWKLFKELDDESKNEYISYLADRFNVTGNELAEMFDCNVSTVRRYVNTLPTAEKFTRGRRMSKDQREEWNKFISGEGRSEVKERGSQATGAVEQKPEKPSEPTATAKDTIQRMERVTLSFDGPIDIRAIFELLKKFVREDSVTKLEVSCTQSVNPAKKIGVAIA